MKTATKVFHILSVLILFSCSDPSLESKTYTIIFENDTDYTLTISHFADWFDPFQIGPGETKSVKSEYYVSIIDISHLTTQKVIDYEKIGESKIRIYQYNYTVEYKITGTANRVDVTLNNSTGGTEQYSDVPIPKSYKYKQFSDWFLYISAQNQGQTGTVTVSIYYKDNLFKTSTSSGAYVIATASGSKP